jgi:transposase
VGVDCTGVYWENPYRILSHYGLNVKAFHPQYIKNVPGKNTDTSASQWLATVVRFGMVNTSFVLPPEWIDMRAHARQRQYVASDLARIKNRFDKILADSGIRLGALVRDINGRTAKND